MSAQNLQKFAAILQDTYARIDWHKLGSEYCFEGGENFFTDEAVEAIQDAGLHIASDMEAKLANFESPNSLYVGPGVAELVMMLFETLVLGRKVSAVTLPGVEPDEINRVWTGLSKEYKVTLPKFVTQPLLHSQETTCSHLWFASVVTDPDSFPALHDRLYKRQDTHHAIGGGNLTKETERAEKLVITALSWVHIPSLITTSQEELELFHQAIDGRGLRFTVPSQGRLSPIVGDSLFHCDLRWA
ncbi:MAG: hypothetical protein JKY61_02645 [Planctomycetes bacterium]|nr:hypothetical protein [Planctomycetota bacterium]